MLPPVALQPLDGFIIARDDLLPGGTKRRAMLRWLLSVWRSDAARSFHSQGLRSHKLAGVQSHPSFIQRPDTAPTYDGFVYAGTVFGLAGLALAHSCATLGVRCVLFYSRPKIRPPVFDDIEALGAQIVLTDAPAPLSHVEVQAKHFAASHGYFFVPPGCHDTGFIHCMAEVLREVNYTPQEVWACAVSGTFSLAAQLAWPDATHHAVCVVKNPLDTGHAIRHFAPQKYHQAAALPPPYPAFLQCDAKVWAIAKNSAQHGALIWNIGA